MAATWKEPGMIAVPLWSLDTIGPGTQVHREAVADTQGLLNRLARKFKSLHGGELAKSHISGHPLTREQGRSQ